MLYWALQMLLSMTTSSGWVTGTSVGGGVNNLITGWTSLTSQTLCPMLVGVARSAAGKKGSGVSGPYSTASAGM